jgi:hypothetical protein
MTEKCMKCKKEGEDRRTLYMSCFYDMDELAVPFVHEKLYKIDVPVPDAIIECFTIRVCKKCRADWLHMIEAWFNINMPIFASCGSGIFIRKFGVNVEVTEEEFRCMHPDIEPIRFKG